MYRKMREHERYHGDSRADQYTPHQAAHGVAADDHPVRQRRHQQFLDVLAELGAEERGHDVTVGVGDHRHHDEAGRDVLLVVEPVHGADAAPEHAAEDREIQYRSHHRGDDGLTPDADDASVLADDDRLEPDPAHNVEADRLRGRLHHAAHQGVSTRARPRVAAGSAPLRTPSPVPARPSTSCMKISSSRFTLLRMLSTSMPSAERRAKMSLRFSSFETSTSSVWSSTSVVT